MKKSKHTPGPWKWYWQTLNSVTSVDETDCGVFWEEHEGQAYSVCRAPRYATKEQREANAQLIAAAPELLTVAKGCLGYLNALPESGSCRPDADWLKPLIAAIAKAEGK